jgi:hypothetical protein
MNTDKGWKKFDGEIKDAPKGGYEDPDIVDSTLQDEGRVDPKEIKSKISSKFKSRLGPDSKWW